MTWSAQWIWLDQVDRRPYNQTVIARKTFELSTVAAASLAITADSQYRLFINGQWVEDGPCRSWPQHYQYDVLDVTTLLRPGRNVIAVVAIHFGIATFHRIPQEAGLLAQLTVDTADGQTFTIATDESWKVHESPAHLRDAARMCIQREQSEWYDARLALNGAFELAFDDGEWAAARAYYPAHGGPWHDLHPRDVPFLTREPMYPRCVRETTLVHGPVQSVTFDVKRLCYPEDRSANTVPMAGALATVLVSEQVRTVKASLLPPLDGALYCNGQPVAEGMLALQAGENLLTLIVHEAYGHAVYTLTLGFDEWHDFTQRNPCAAGDANPWAWVGPFAPMSPVTNLDNRNSGPISDEVIATLKQLGASADAPTFAALAGDRYHRVPPEVMFLRDSILPFTERRVQGPADALITNRAALLAENLAVTIVHPSADGDVELCLDLGKEVVGWVEFSLRAPEGTLVDIYLVEYRNAERIQHTGVMRNGFRYVAQDGLNHFVSLKRLAGRYLFLTLREMTGPVKIQYARVLQATYPVERRGAFRCSDVALTHIWEISAYTLRLCMEDTYTDCPLYEQTLWVGDARNESLYNAICYGAHDLTLRCLRLCAQSLDTLPIVGSQLPSSWNGLLPAWSFLWGLNVWEYYFTTGDLAGLRELYPAVLRNLRNAQGYCTDRGLFSIPAWNFFDWTGIDDKSRTVLFNSLILLGAIDAALQCCATLGESDAPWLQDFHDELLSALLPLWDDAKGSYPDSIHDDGTVSASVCQHTSVLGVLYDALPPAARDIAVRHIIAPPEGMVRIGSPFALQYALEALEKSGDVAHALQLVRALWQDMLDCGATTCWETFRNVDAPFPTRSHCHAWSSAPIYMFNRLILGIVPTGVAASEVVVSPHPLDLTWAEGVSASVRGDLRVSWRREGETLSITVEMPAGVTWRVLANDDWRGITRVVINGVEHPELLPAVAGQFV